MDKVFPKPSRQPRNGIGKATPDPCRKAWLGNSPRTAEKHYLSVTDDDFAKAVGGATVGARVVQQWVPQPSAADCNGMQEDEESQDLTPGSSLFPAFLELNEHAWQDSNLRPTD